MARKYRKSGRYKKTDKQRDAEAKRKRLGLVRTYDNSRRRARVYFRSLRDTLDLIKQLEEKGVKALEELDEADRLAANREDEKPGLERNSEAVLKRKHKSRGILKARGIKRKNLLNKRSTQMPVLDDGTIVHFEETEFDKLREMSLSERREYRRNSLIPNNRLCIYCSPPRIILNSKQWVVMTNDGSDWRILTNRDKIIRVCCIKCFREFKKGRTE